MARLFSIRGLASILLVVVPVVLIILQQIWGTFLLRPDTSDSTIFYLLCALGMVAGFAIEERTPHGMFRNALISAALLIGLPMLVSGFIAGNDFVNGTEITAGKGFFFALDALGSQISEWTFIIQAITAIIPIAVLLIGIVGIYLADNFDEMQVPIIETIAAIGMMVLAAMLFGWLGIKIF